MPQSSSTAALLDCIVHHLGFYDRALSWPPRSGSAAALPPASAEGDALRRWLRKLSPEARQEALTVHDSPWVSLLLAMQAQLQKEGGSSGVFFVDVDMPPVLRGPDADLPAVCFRRARGLPARLPAQQGAQRWLMAALRVAPPAVRLCADACGDVDALLAAADELSWGQFLSRPPAWRVDGAAHASRAGLALGSGPGAAERWVETPWLGVLGYYSLEQWVLNRLEVAIWARLRAASRAASAPPRALPAATPAARWAALPPETRVKREREPGNAACAARTVAAALRPTGAAARDWPAARAALEMLIDAVDAVFAPWRDVAPAEQSGIIVGLLWQPLAVAATPAGVLRGRVGAACVAAAEARAERSAEETAAALLRDEAADKRAEEEARRRRADKRARARDSARSRRIADEDAAAAAAAAAVVRGAVERLIASAAASAPPLATPLRPPLLQQRRQSAGSGKRAKQLGWLPGVGDRVGPPLHQQLLSPEDSPESVHRGVMARVRSTPLFAASQATSAPNSPLRSSRASPRLGSPPPAASRPPRSSRPHAQPDYGEIFGISSGSFWSSADLAAWPSGSRASSVSSDDSTITNSSVAGWREAVVGNVLAEQHLDAAAAMGFYAPEDDGGSTPRNRISRSMSGSPDDRGGAGGWARIAALRPSSARSGARPTRGTSESPARPASPLVMFPTGQLGAQSGQLAGAGASRPRLGSHDDARAAAVATPPAGPAPPQLSLAPGATPRLSAELLRRVAAPAVCAGAPSLYADAAAQRRRFWAEGGSAAATAATRLGAQLEAFAAAVGDAALQARPARLEAVTRVTRALQDLWPRARTRVFGSEATGLALPSSDVDLVVALPPVRQALRPIMEAGILEGRNAIEESHVKQAARQLARQEWASADTMLSVENTAVPIVSLAVRCAPPPAAAVRVDLSFDAPGHAGLTSAELVRELLARYPALAPLALALKQFLKERSLHHAYTGGLSSYCLLLLLAAYTKHAAALDGPLPLGRLFADVLAFYGRAFDPRRSAVALAAPAPPPGAAAAPPPDVAALFPPRGGREALIDVLHICDPLQLTHGQDVNVARNCFRMLQIQKALADASKLLDEQLLADEGPLLESLICTRI